MSGLPNQGFSYREQIGPRAQGRTVLAHLTREYEHTSEADWQVRLHAGEVVLDDATSTGAETLRLGQWLTWNRPPWVEPEAPLSFDVLYEDADLLAVSKPSGLPTMAGGDFLEHTLLHLVRQRAPTADPMHRLGRGTSGIVLFALSDLARTVMQEAWRGRQVRKIYRALVDGSPPEDAFTIQTPIGLVAHPLVGEIFAATPKGKGATSHVRVLERRPATTLVEVVIETGRPHQIRIHLASVGFPLSGDPLYLAGGSARDTAVPGDLGYLLHAATLGFNHPRSGEELLIESAPPEVLRAR